MHVDPQTTEHSFDFHRPITVHALARFDRDLVLVWNKRWESFQVLRRKKKLSAATLSDGTTFGMVVDDYTWVYEWRDGLLGRDDPWPLIHELRKSDIFENPRLSHDRMYEWQLDRRRREAAVHDNYKHAFASNRSQVLKLYGMLRDMVA